MHLAAAQRPMVDLQVNGFWCHRQYYTEHAAKAQNLFCLWRKLGFLKLIVSRPSVFRDFSTHVSEKLEKWEWVYYRAMNSQSLSECMALLFCQTLHVTGVIAVVDVHKQFLPFNL